jgi:hypothetical protein
MTTVTRGKTRAEVDGGRFGAGLVRARQSRATGDSGERASTALVSAEVFRLDLAEKGEDVLGGARVEDPPPRFPASVTLGADESRPRDFQKMTMREVNETMERAMRNEPIVLSRTGVLGDVSSRYAADRDPGLEQEWDFKRLAEMAGEGEWECYVCPSREHKFMVCDDDKNSHGSYYHVREPQVEKMQCKFKDFVQCAQTWREKSILFDAELLDGSAVGKEFGILCAVRKPIRWKMPRRFGDIDSAGNQMEVAGFVYSFAEMRRSAVDATRRRTSRRIAARQIHPRRLDTAPGERTTTCIVDTSYLFL